MNIPHPKPKLAICTPIPHIRLKDGQLRAASVSWEWHCARLRLQIPFGFDAAEIGITGLEVGEARNKAVKYAIEQGCEMLFFLDYDVLPAPHCLKQLMYRATATHPGFDIYSGLYCVKEHPSVPILYHGWNNGPYWDWDFGDVLTEGIVASGLGCALLDLRLFDKISEPWFKTAEVEGGGTVTEDCYFTKALTDAGGRILVDLDRSCICWHQDPVTSEIFCLEPDSPPVVRAGIKPTC